MNPILIVIPARGGSVGIPGKALAPINGRPLITFSIATALTVKDKWESGKIDVCVSSDDDEILSVAEAMGVRTIKRPAELAEGHIPLDPVIQHALEVIESEDGIQRSFVITQQPTTPLLSPDTLLSALEKFRTSDETTDTLISVSEERFLSWKPNPDTGDIIPNYEARVNRQQLPPIYKETGSFLICRASALRQSGERVGAKIDVFPVIGAELIDIDTPEEFALCRYYMNRRKIVFAVIGNREIGLGHVSRCLIIANALVEHEVLFVFDSHSAMGKKIVEDRKYSAVLLDDTNWVKGVMKENPDVVINDRLDTHEQEILTFKNAGLKIVNFEDLGPGASVADIVFNDLYPHHGDEGPLYDHLTHSTKFSVSNTVNAMKIGVSEHIFPGPRYFCARAEFRVSPQKVVSDSVENILITFGGTDPNNFTRKILEAIGRAGIKIEVILGMGYDSEWEDELRAAYADVPIRRNVKNMAKKILEADLVFTSAGRTIYEIACIGTPAIVLAQNNRELSHYWANEENGFLNLGLGVNVHPEQISANLQRIVEDPAFYRQLSEKMLSHDLRTGINRVIGPICRLLDAHSEE